MAKSTVDLEPPSADELEVSIFGPGYGECVLVHVGGGEWIVIDSCMDTRRGVQPALAYLKSMSVDPAEAIRVVVASHWHDDHVRGIASVLAECTDAVFCCSSALFSDEMLTVLGLVDSDRLRRTSALSEMRQVFDLLEVRGHKYLRLASSDSPVYTTSAGGPACAVTALSPSAAAHLRSLETFKPLVDQVSSAVRPKGGPNFASVALHVQFGDTAVLLGSDLEDYKDPALGWQAIVESTLRPTAKASIHKVPHHGSANAHHDGVYTELLNGPPLSLLTPFRRGSVQLPTTERVQKILDHSASAFITADWKRRLPARLPARQITTARFAGARELSELYGQCGHVQVRIAPSASPRVFLGEPARRLTA